MGQETKEARSGAGIWWRRLGQELFGGGPQFDCLQVEVSSRCLGRCRYCPRTHASAGPGEDMSLAVFSRLQPVLERAQRVHLQGWGEPFLNPYFFAMARLAREAGCRVSTTTCGLSMSEARAEEILDAGLDIVAFSLAGTDEASNSRWRTISFEQVCRAIAILVEAKRRRNASEPQLHLAYLLLSDNVEALAGLPRLMEELDLAATVVSTLDYLPSEDLFSQRFTDADRAMLARAEALLAEAATTAERLGRQLHHHLSPPQGIGGGCFENIGRSFFVAADGTVSPCVFTNAPGAPKESCRLFGNVLDEEPLRLWSGHAYSHFRNALAEGCPQNPCITCPKRFGLSR